MKRPRKVLRSGPASAWERAAAPARPGLAGLAWLVSLAALALAPSVAAAPQGGNGDVATRARDLFKKGREEYARDHLPQAYALFSEAWSLQKTFDIAGNLALVENQLAHYRDAADHATYALANFPAGGSETQHKALEDVLTKAKANLGVLTVRTSIPQATVTLDGQGITLTPPASPTESASAEVFIEPGVHALLATAPGCDPASDSVRAEKGGTHLVTLAPQCGPKEAPPPPPPPPKTEEPGPRPLTIAGFVTMGVGFGVGAALAIVSKMKANDADTQGAHLGPNACAAMPPSPACVALHDARTSQGALANGSLWTFVGAGVVGAATLAYTLAAPRPAAPAAPTAGATKAARIRILPAAGPTGASLLLEGTF
jgi:hypothetical protein